MQRWPSPRNCSPCPGREASRSGRQSAMQSGMRRDITNSKRREGKNNMKKAAGKISSPRRREKIGRWGKEKAYVRFFPPTYSISFSSPVQSGGGKIDTFINSPCRKTNSALQPEGYSVCPRCPCGVFQRCLMDFDHTGPLKECGLRLLKSHLDSDIK